jgi:uncharacterized protein
MRITFDPAKRDITLKVRGFDFGRAEEVFEGPTFTQQDERRDYGEIRYQTYGRYEGQFVMVVWTRRYEARHIISMRKCNAKEKRDFAWRLGRS